MTEPKPINKFDVKVKNKHCHDRIPVKVCNTVKTKIKGTLNLSQDTITQLINGFCACISSGGILPIEKATITNQAVLANTDVFAIDIVPSNPPSFMVIEASYSDDGNAILEIIIKNGVNSFATFLSHGDLLINGTTNVRFVDSGAPTLKSLQHSDFLLHTGDTFNIQFNSNTTINILRITEVKSIVGR